MKGPAMISKVAQGSVVPFPSFTEERVYMREFTQRDGLPADLARWQPTVDAMLGSVKTDLPMFLMVDQAFVRAGVAHRRPGLHVDMHWNPGPLLCHGGIPESRHLEYIPPRHRSQPASPGHIAIRPSHHDVPVAPPGHGPTLPLRHASGLGSEAVLLASDVVGCRAWVGEYEGDRGAGGSYDVIDTSRLKPLMFDAGRCYAGHTMTMLHESVPLLADAHRTVVRLNVPGWSP